MSHIYENYTTTHVLANLTETQTIAFCNDYRTSRNAGGDVGKAGSVFIQGPYTCVEGFALNLSLSPII